MKTYIHVNRNKIDSNRKHNKTDPVITVKNYKTNKYGKKVDILDKEGNIVASVIYSPKRPLACGAKVWIETESKIKIS